MAAEIWSKELENALKNGDVELAKDNKFVDTKGNVQMVRNMDAITDLLEVGEVIDIPSDYKVVTLPITGTDLKYSCIYAEVTGVDGVVRATRFTPNSLAKVANPVDPNRNNARLPKVKTGGKVAQWYQNFAAQGATVDDVMKELAGKKLKVVSAESYVTMNYRTNQTQNTRIYHYDWA